MHKFEDIKDSLCNGVNQLSKGIHDICNNVKEIYYGNPLLKYHLSENKIIEIEAWRMGLETNLSMILRSKMKCAFFGKTSNGKSAVINAILAKEVLPSCCGRTTSCFITVEGCNEPNGYFLDKHDFRRDIGVLDDVASEYDDNSYGTDSQIRVFWPSSKCTLLEHEVQLLDSPGCDVSFDKDSWIEKYCLDADVFVYVVDSTSTPCSSERDFFKKVKQKIGTPNLFFLFNKWDGCQNNSNVMTLKQQHLDTIRTFLRDDMGTAIDPEDRSFFVSATKSLHNPTPEFNQFVAALTTEMTYRAITTKFKQHSDRACEVIPSVIGLLDTIIKFDNLDQQYDNFAVKLHIKTLIDESFENSKTSSLDDMESKCQKFCSSLSEKIQKRISTANDITLFIETLLKRLFDNLQKNVDKILPNIIEALISTADVKVDKVVLASYIPKSFNELMSRCEKKFQKNNINNEITNAYNELDSYLCRDSDPEVRKYTNTFLDFGIHAFKCIFTTAVNVVTDIVTSVSDLVTGTNRQSALEGILRERISSSLRQSIENIIDKSQTKITDRIGMLSDIYFKDCSEIKELTTELKELRNNLCSVSEDLYLVQVRIGSIDY